ANECLYNKFSLSYKLGEKKNNVWREIAAEMEVPEELFEFSSPQSSSSSPSIDVLSISAEVRAEPPQKRKRKAKDEDLTEALSAFKSLCDARNAKLEEDEKIPYTGSGGWWWQQ
ncbi:hypothetical protein DOY81_007856, partial [Sarcophaga bullata]